MAETDTSKANYQFKLFGWGAVLVATFGVGLTLIFNPGILYGRPYWQWGMLLVVGGIAGMYGLQSHLTGRRQNWGVILPLLAAIATCAVGFSTVYSVWSSPPSTAPATITTVVPVPEPYPVFSGFTREQVEAAKRQAVADATRGMIIQSSANQQIEAATKQATADASKLRNQIQADQKTIQQLQTKLADTAKGAGVEQHTASGEFVPKSQLDSALNNIHHLQQKMRDAEINTVITAQFNIPPSGLRRKVFDTLITIFDAATALQTNTVMLGQKIMDPRLHHGLTVFVPPCTLILSSRPENAFAAQLIKAVGMRNGCAVSDELPPPKSTDADSPAVVVPSPLPYVVVRYPRPEDAIKIKDEPVRVAVANLQVEEQATRDRDSLADAIVQAFRACGTDARRSHKTQGSPGWAPLKWGIYIEFGTATVCGAS